MSPHRLASIVHDDDYYLRDFASSALWHSRTASNAVNRDDGKGYWRSHESPPFSASHTERFAAHLIYRTHVYLLLADLLGCPYSADALRSELVQRSGLVSHDRPVASPSGPQPWSASPNTLVTARSTSCSATRRSRFASLSSSSTSSAAQAGPPRSWRSPLRPGAASPPGGSVSTAPMSTPPSPGESATTSPAPSQSSPHMACAWKRTYLNGKPLQAR